MLHLVWRQSIRFSVHESAISRQSLRAEHSAMSDTERDKRTGGQWLRAITSYCEFRAGDAWRRLSDPNQRNAPERLWYLGGIRTLNGIKVSAPLEPRPQLVADSSASDREADRLASRSRTSLVDELMLLDTSLSDRRLLSHFTCLKLARMVVSARAARATEERRSA